MKKIIFVFGNGNLSFNDFIKYYQKPIIEVLIKENKPNFIICDYKGVDTLMMEFLKYETPNVSIFHIGERPRYLPDKYKTQVSQWKLFGGYISDRERDDAAINSCTHFLGYDFNSDENRKSSSKINIEECLSKNKVSIATPSN